MRWGYAVLALGVLAGCQPRQPLPDMQPGEIGRVVRVIDGDAFVLHTGQSVRLVGIEAPALRPRGRDPDPYAVEAARALEDIVMGRQVQLFYPGLTRDRYDRALAHVVTVDGAGPKVWLNRELVARGAARVRLYADTSVRGDELLAVEADARESGTGLWTKRDYAIVASQDVSASDRGFMLVRARLGPAREAASDRRGARACVRRVADGDLIIDIRPEAASLCQAPDGTDYVLRGWVSRGRLDL